MKTIRFNFNHPVNGNAILTPINSIGCTPFRMRAESSKDHSLEIPVNGCDEGKWRLTLDWEYEGRAFSHQEDFEVTKL
jgi:hypothetical protein